ncbi:MAG TPA: biopolymer transporter ExbD [Flavisolibacter sp.]|nr:biopolymer transporter ExbD [Flavisolibacter sp.]
MAEIITAPNTSKKRRSIRKSLRIDMTPMVDLGFLLITFFIFTSSMAEPYVTKLYMPADGMPNKQPQSSALTVLLAKDNRIYFYEGQWEAAMQNKMILTTTYDLQKGLGKIIRQKQQRLGKSKEELMLLIKPLEESTYANIVNILDEVQINGVKRYAIAEATPDEKAFVK